MDQKIDKNLLITRILSVLAAIILWFYVAHSENPEIEIWIRGIEVSFVSEESLSDNSLTILNDDEIAPLSIKVKGQRSSVGDITSKNVKATVDLSTIKSPGDYNMPINISLPTNAVSITNKSAHEITVCIDKISSLRKEVKLNITGDDENKTTLLSNPKEVSISGPASVIEELSAVVNVDLEGETFSEYTINLLNSDGTPYSGSEVVLHNRYAKLTAQREVPVKAEVNPPENVNVTSILCEPQFVKVSGSIRDVIEALEISLGVVDFKWEESPETVSDIPVICPQNLTFDEEQIKASVTVEYEIQEEAPTEVENE